MIIPKYWAEAHSEIKINERNQTYRRFGWSNLSNEDAQLAAKKRVDEAVTLAQAGENVRRIDHKVAYNGAEGLPIREEVIRTFDEVVISRNSYGALCLNTPDVVFADIDIIENSFRTKLFPIYILLLLGAIFFGVSDGLKSVGFFTCTGTLMALFFLEMLYRCFSTLFLPSAEERALNKIRKFSKKNQDWRLRIYRTPHGYRVMVMHTCFSANDEEVYRFFDAVGTDPYYVKMCQNRQCFRARVSPKPWRMHMDRIASGSGVWPVKPERLKARQQWVRQYEHETRKFSACAYIESVGSKHLDPTAERVRAIHDDYSQAGRSLPLA